MYNKTSIIVYDVPDLVAESKMNFWRILAIARDVKRTTGIKGTRLATRAGLAYVNWRHAERIIAAYTDEELRQSRGAIGYAPSFFFIQGWKGEWSFDCQTLTVTKTAWDIRGN